jgi:hypothetical protein
MNATLYYTFLQLYQDDVTLSAIHMVHADNIPHGVCFFSKWHEHCFFQSGMNISWILFFVDGCTWVILSKLAYDISLIVQGLCVIIRVTAKCSIIE